MNINLLIKQYEEDEKRICKQGYADYNVIEHIVGDLKTLQKEQREWIGANSSLSKDYKNDFEYKKLMPLKVLEAFGLEEE